MVYKFHVKGVRLIQRVVSIFVAFSILIACALPVLISSNKAEALSPLQKKVLSGGALYANTEEYCSSAKSSTTTSTDSSGALGLMYPKIGNESELGNNLTNYIKKNAPSSPWLNIDANIGQWLFNESKTRNINPLLVAAIGKQENGFGTGGQIQVTNYYNYFGMVGATPIDIPNSEYRGFNSPKEGLIYFLDTVKNNTQSTSRGSYASVANLYEYLSVHQTGKIIYPGESLGTENGGIDGFDPIMQVYISWTTTDHPNDTYDGNLYNPGVYYSSSVEFINQITGLSLQPVASKTSASGCLGFSSTGGSGLVDSSGYSFPLAPQTKSVGGIGVGWSGLLRPDGKPIHGDNTAAYDLFSTDSADVYSIYGGVIDSVNTSFNDVPGCTAIELYADDGYYYAFLHLKNPVVAEGTRVTAGQKIAQIADASFGETCRGSSPHLHVDRGCVVNGEPQHAGRGECRDPDFIPFLSILYAGLPGR